MQVNAEGFLSGTTDIPVPPNLYIESNDNLDFDTPAGQIISLVGTSTKSCKEDIVSFYQNTLPKMGWVEIKEGVFKRNKDVFSITILKKEKPLKVRFDISLEGSI